MLFECLVLNNKNTNYHDQKRGTKMRKTNLIITLVLAIVILNGVCFSLVLGKDNQALPEYSAVPNQAQPGFTAGEGSNLNDDGIASEINLPLVAASIVLAIIVIVLSAIVCYIKFIERKK
jgi:hypothetical protein